MDDVFAPGGAHEGVLPEYEPRREQAALAAAVEHVFVEVEAVIGHRLELLVPPERAS